MSGVQAARLNAVIWAVTVVPILAPMMTAIAWVRPIRPELTKPMTIMSVADELWIRTVTRTPTRTAITLLDVTFSRISRSLSPAARPSPLDMVLMPYKNSPTPPKRLNTSYIVIKLLSLHFGEADGDLRPLPDYTVHG